MVLHLAVTSPSVVDMPLLVEVTHLVDLQHGVVPYNLGLALALEGSSSTYASAEKWALESPNAIHTSSLTA